MCTELIRPILQVCKLRAGDSLEEMPDLQQPLWLLFLLTARLRVMQLAFCSDRVEQRWYPGWASGKDALLLPGPAVEFAAWQAHLRAWAWPSKLGSERKWGPEAAAHRRAELSSGWGAMRHLRNCSFTQRGPATSGAWVESRVKGLWRRKVGLAPWSPIKLLHQLHKHSPVRLI